MDRIWRKLNAPPVNIQDAANAANTMNAMNATNAANAANAMDATAAAHNALEELRVLCDGIGDVDTAMSCMFAVASTMREPGLSKRTKCGLLDILMEIYKNYRQCFGNRLLMLIKGKLEEFSDDCEYGERAQKHLDDLDADERGVG